MCADIKGANQKHRNEQLNRSIQNFLYGLLATDNDVAAKKSLAVLTELWRRHVWRDARTVNVIGKLAVEGSSMIHSLCGHEIEFHHMWPRQVKFMLRARLCTSQQQPRLALLWL